jgi:hypothetical protein
MREINIKLCVYRVISTVVITSILAVSSAFAQTAHTYATEMVVSEGKKSVTTDADLILNEKTFTVIPDKSSFKSLGKDLNYSDVKVADYSFAKKPMLSSGGAIALSLLTLMAIPLLFVKKKNHWLTIQTEKEFVVLKLGGNNFRQIIADFETHGVKVNDLGDEKYKKDKDK